MTFGWMLGKLFLETLRAGVAWEEGEALPMTQLLSRERVKPYLSLTLVPGKLRLPRCSEIFA